MPKKAEYPKFLVMERTTMKTGNTRIITKRFKNCDEELQFWASLMTFSASDPQPPNKYKYKVL